MYVRIPTGIHTLSQTAQGKRLIEYRCTRCGQTHLQDFCITTTQAAQYHAFGGKKARLKAENKVRQRTMTAMETLDSTLFHAINIYRDYSQIYAPVICPTCGEKQPWSIVPKPWTRSRGFGFWIAGIAILGLASLLMAISGKSYGLMFLLCEIVLLILPFIRKQTRKNALEALRNMPFQPPKYYNRTNIHELRGSQIANDKP